MAGFSTWLESGLLGWLKGISLGPAPAAVWLGLWNGDPGDAGTGGAEVTATIRPGGRVAVGFGTVSASAMSNAGVVDFGTAAAAASVTHVALFDAASGGNLLLSAPLGGGTQSVAAGNGVTVGAGALAVALG